MSSKNYDRYSKSRYYIKNKNGVREVAEIIRGSDEDILTLATKNIISQYVIDQLVLEGYSLYKKHTVDNTTYIVMCKD